MNKKKKCFVIMPISGTKSCTEREWTGIYENMIKLAVTGSKLGFECERAKPRTGAFIKDILEGLNRADVVIADLTDRNPNVCYELGIRHTLKNRTIIIAQNIKHVPSDLKSYWVVEYKKDLTGANEFKKKVREILREMQKNPDKPDSPVADFLNLKNIDIIAFEKSANLKKLSALITELSYNIDVVNRILNTVKESEECRAKDNKTWHFSNERFNTACVERLISTSYVLLPEELLNNIISTNGGIIAINNRLDLWSQHSYSSGVEEFLKENLPNFKKLLLSLSQKIYKIKIQYDNDNYIEPQVPSIFVSSTEHEEYLKIAK